MASFPGRELSALRVRLVWRRLQFPHFHWWLGIQPTVEYPLDSVLGAGKCFFKRKTQVHLWRGSSSLFYTTLLAFSTILLYFWFKMQDTNEKKLEKLLSVNGGYITRKHVDSHEIPSWFLTDFVRKQGLVKIDKGFYAQEQWIRDDYLVFQYKYPKFIFSHVSALFLHGLTDLLPDYFEVTGPRNYRPFSPKSSITIHTDSHDETYRLGVCKIKTSLGHLVECYDMERTICDIVKNSRKINSEVYGKALRLYAKSKDKNIRNLLRYAQVLKIENKVAELMTVVMEFAAIIEANGIASGKRKAKSYKNANEMIKDIIG